METTPSTASGTPTTVELKFVNNSSYQVSFTPRLTIITPPANGTATLSGTSPVTVPAGATNTSISVTMTPSTGTPVTVTLELDGTVGGTAFALIQAFGVNGTTAEPAKYSDTAPWPLSVEPTLATSPSGGVYPLTLSIDSAFALLPPTRFSVDGTAVLKNGEPFFACGVNYSPTPIGGATFEPGVGDWFTPPWWTGLGNDLGSRDIPLLLGLGANAVRTYFTWYWLKRNDLAYLQGITQSTPMTVYTDTQYPYTVAFDHIPFLNDCYAKGIHVVLGIALEGGNCFNFDNPSVSGAYQNYYLQTAQKLATLYGKHPAVLGFCMSNEQNNPTVDADTRTWEYYRKMYNAIKAAAPDKLALIAFQDDQTLYNGSKTLAGRLDHPTQFDNLPIEQAVSMVVDVWGLNIYSGIVTDFPLYQNNVVFADAGAYARPLFVTEWGTPAGQNDPANVAGPTVGDATGEELSTQGLDAGAQTISSAVATMTRFVDFVAGAFYFEFTDEWWKNTSFDPTLVDTTKSPLDPTTHMYKTNGSGQVCLTGGTWVYPAYPFTHDAGAVPTWPEEWWGLYAAGVAGGRNAFQPSPTDPDTLTARTQYVQALTAGYATIHTIMATARGIAVMEDGVVDQVQVIYGGKGYSSAPTVSITPPGNGGMPAAGVASIANGAVTAVTMTSQGSGYDFGPQVSFSPPTG